MRVRGYRVFYIDQQSGIKDLIELMEKTTAVRMALVVKNGQLILSSSVNLKLLKKYIKKYKKELVFVNPDPVVVKKVVRAGFDIYKDLNALEKDLAIKSISGNANIAARSEDKNKNQEKSKGDYGRFKKITNKATEKTGLTIGFFAIFSVFLILVLAYFYFIYPTAIIEIEPIVQNTNQEIVVSASSSISSIDWESNILPIHQTQVQITGQEEIATSGVKLIGDTRAKGIVRFISEREEDVVISAGTVILAENGLEYRTVEDTRIPKVEVDYLMDVPVGMKAGQAEIGIEAVQPGSRGNMNIGLINKFAEEIDNVYVINPEPSRGGTDKRIPLVSGEDLQTAKKIVDEKLGSSLFTRIYQELGGNYRIIEDTITYSNPQYNYSHEIGDETDLLKVDASILATGYIIKNNEVDRLLTRKFQDNLIDNAQLMSSGINIESLLLEEKGNSMYNIKIRLNAPVMPIIDSDSLAKRLLGLNMIEAQNLLKDMNYIENYRIESQNDRLPNLVFAIKVVVTEPKGVKVINLND